MTARGRTAVVTAVLLVLLSGCAPGPGGPAVDGSAVNGPPTYAAPGGGAQPAAPELRPVDDVVAGLQVPWGLAFLPGGDALVTERDTRNILRVTAAGGIDVVGQVPEAEGGGEGGLLGIAVSPDFATDSLIYVYFSTATENRIERMTFDGSTTGPREPVLTGIPSAIFHDGGALEFGPDGLLYVGTGDATDPPLAQDPTSLAGKILRLNPDGTPPADNPFPGSLVYSLGHRNVQGLAFDSRGDLWASEYGADAFDELNRIEPGANYGWPQAEGRNGGGPGLVPPAVQWPVEDNSPSGITIVDDVVHMAALRGERLWQIPVTAAGAGEPVAELAGEYGRLRTVEQASDGTLWVVTGNTDGRGTPGPGDDRILRVAY